MFSNSARSVFAASALLFSLVSAPALLPAQQDAGTASITGTVLDAGGKGLQNADVAVKNESSALVRKVTTGADGRFAAADLPAGIYKIDVSAPGFSPGVRAGQKVDAGEAKDISITLSVANVSQAVTVEAGPDSIASRLAPVNASLDQISPHSEIKQEVIENFDSPIADFTAILQMAPGTFSVSPNGTGLGQSNTYFRGFADGLYTMTYDGIPFEDTNSPTHHSWAFFPAQWLGGVDFDRSPGTASSVGPTNFGGTINLLSPKPASSPDIRASVSYGSWNTRLLDLSIDSGDFGGGKSSLFADVHQRMCCKNDFGLRTDVNNPSR